MLDLANLEARAVLAHMTDVEQTRRIAALVEFYPNAPGLAQECFEETALPDGFPKQHADQARFYIALGLFVYWKYDENCIERPDEIEDWYRTNTGITNNMADIFRPVSAREAA